MDSARFAEIAQQRIELGNHKCEIRDRMQQVLHIPSEDPSEDDCTGERVFSSLDDAIEYRALIQQREEIEHLKRELAKQAVEEGLPAECWIKVDLAGDGQGEPFGIKLRETQSSFFEIPMSRWSVVEEYAEQAQMSRSRN